jgi:ribose transport system permease protein
MSAAPGPAARADWRQGLRRHLRALGVASSLVLLIAIFSVWRRLHAGDWNFVGAINLQTMASQSVIVSLGALGMSYVIISGGIDLSIGSGIALSMVVTAWLLQHAGAGAALAVTGGVATGALIGCANGLLITACRLVPFIATLGMMGIARGLAKLIAKNELINIQFDGWSGSWLALLTRNPVLFAGAAPPAASATRVPPWLLVAPSVWLLLALAIAMDLILRRSIFGRRLVAIGSNEAAARLCGIAVDRMKVAIYAAGGLCSGLAGVVFCSRQTQGDPTAATGYELDVIAAVVIGGGSLSGGEGSIFGSLAGALVMVVLRTGLRMVDIGDAVQQALIGAIIIAAVVIDRLQHRTAD